MIINTDIYNCKKCKKMYFFDTDKPYSKICPICNNELSFEFNANRDTELAEKVKNMPPYDPTKDPNSQFYVPRIECPYCKSTNTRKIGAVSRMMSTGFLGLASKKVGKQWHCNSCKSDF